MTIRIKLISNYNPFRHNKALSNDVTCEMEGGAKIVCLLTFEFKLAVRFLLERSGLYRSVII